MFFNWFKRGPKEKKVKKCSSESELFLGYQCDLPKGHATAHGAVTSVERQVDFTIGTGETSRDGITGFQTTFWGEGDSPHEVLRANYGVDLQEWKHE